MNIGSQAAVQPSIQSQVDPGQVRARQNPIPLPGSGSTGENQQPKPAPTVAPIPQDVVKVQLKPPGEIVVYQFVDQAGTVVLQVPPQQLLELAQQISQELAQEAAPKQAAGNAGGETNGH